jgi:hypothetical protein
MCYDDASCAAQPPAFTSSATAARGVFLGGIFATGSSLKNIQFGDANVVWVSYCTSDAWAGDVGPTAAALSNATAPGAWAGFSGGFRGQRILRATLQTMQKSLTFGSADNTQLLLGGCTPGVVRSGAAAQRAALRRGRVVRGACGCVTRRRADALRACAGVQPGHCGGHADRPGHQDKCARRQRSAAVLATRFFLSPVR